MFRSLLGQRSNARFVDLLISYKLIVIFGPELPCTRQASSCQPGTERQRYPRLLIPNRNPSLIMNSSVMLIFTELQNFGREEFGFFPYFRTELVKSVRFSQSTHYHKLNRKKTCIYIYECESARLTNYALKKRVNITQISLITVSKDFYEA